MPISVQCAVCGRKARIRDELAGRRIACPECRAGISVPLQAAAEQSPFAAPVVVPSPTVNFAGTKIGSGPDFNSRVYRNAYAWAIAGIIGLLFAVVTGIAWWRSVPFSHVAALRSLHPAVSSQTQPTTDDVRPPASATDIERSQDTNLTATSNSDDPVQSHPASSVPQIVAAEIPAGSVSSQPGIVEFQPLQISELVTSMAMTEDGKSLVLSHQAADQVTVYDVQQQKVVSTISTGSPRSILCRNNMAFVANHGLGTISVFSASDSWRQVASLKVGHPNVVHLSAAAGRYFQNELIVTCHGSGSSASYQDSHVFRLDLQTGQCREISNVAVATVSYDGRIVVTQGSFNLSPSGGIAAYEYQGFAEGNAEPKFRGGVIQTPYVYQFCPGGYWPGSNMIFGGEPLEPVADWKKELLIPDLSQKLVYSAGERELQALRLSPAMEPVGTREVRFPDSYRDFSLISNPLQRTREYLLDHPAAFTHGDRVFLFVLCAKGGVVLKAEAPAFEVPARTQTEPQLAELHEMPSTLPAAGTSSLSDTQSNVRQQSAGTLPDAGASLAVADSPKESSSSLGMELNEFSPEVAQRLSEVERLRQSGEWSAAIEIATKIYNEARERNGDSERDIRLLGELCEELRKIDELTDRIAEYRGKREFFHASVLAQRVLKIETQHFGVDHPKAAECRAWATAIRKEMTDNARPWMDLESRIAAAVEKKDLGQAIQTALALCDLKRSTMGNDHTALAASLRRVAELLKADHRLAEAIPYYEEAARITEKFHGPDNYRVKLSRDTLADVRRTVKLSLPKQIRIQAIQNRPVLVASDRDPAVVRKEVSQLESDAEFLLENLGEQSASYLSTLLNLAEGYRRLGDLKNTERTQELARQLITRHLDTNHPLYVDLAINLSATYRSIHDLDKCLQYGQDAVVISRMLYGEEDMTHINALNEYANTLHRVRDFPEEKRILSLAIALNLVVSGPDHISLARQYANLAHTHDMLGEKPLARANAEQAIRILRATSATKSTTYVNTLNLLAMLDRAAGDLENAERRFDELVRVSREVYGPKHYSHALNLSNVAGLCHQQGKLEKAVALFEELLPVLRSQRDETFSVQSEEQQLLTSQDFLGIFFGYISVATQIKDSQQRLYDELLKWKGAVFLRQGIGGLKATDTAPLEQLALQLETGRRMSELVSSMLDHPASSGPQFEVLQQLRPRYSAACREVAFQTSRSTTTAGDFDPVADVNSLPEDIAIVDFQEYNHRSWATADRSPAGRKEPRLLAFIVRRSKPVVMVELGAMDRIEAALKMWQNSLVRGDGRPAPGRADSPQEVLAELVWRPVEKHLQGAETVILCPDGSLIEIPFAALPGRNPNSYLLEDYGLATIPTPHLIPRILKSRPESRTVTSALLVGDVNFSGSSASPASQAVAMRAAGFQFSPLPGTTSEINGIEKLFRQAFPDGSLTVATKDMPTEDFVYRTAGENQYVHLATHGFYAPRNWAAGQQSKQEQQLKQYIEQYLPSLLSGLALAGANRNHASAQNSPAADLQDDGLLTSLEVAALDLRNVDLAVLSACESTLGQAPFGEGMLGLQRAFQVAGVRSTVTSLWKVDDAATQALMVEFYKNLWERRMSKLESLRQAQLTMLNRYDASSGQLKSRGLTLTNPEQKASADTRLAPYYWASFVLSGDWQ